VLTIALSRFKFLLILKIKQQALKTIYKILLRPPAACFKKLKFCFLLAAQAAAKKFAASPQRNGLLLILV
jgi:hypothetical protein